MDTTNFPEFITSLSQDFVSVISTEFSENDYIAIDLSKHNKALDAIDVSSSKDFERYISEYVHRNNAKVAYGGYNETRNIYRRSTHFNQANPDTERNIHLGLDIWCDANTEILSPLAGTIHSFKNNNNFGDYGPTIIIKHNINHVVFYSLYGHLSLTSLVSVEVGHKIAAGECIGTLGDATINGDYAPHLHFQIIKDLQGHIGDYPGVSSRRDLEFYLQNCPDPNLLLKIK
ncbi:peptidoglycan DD-metalloendopeptidase family protein [Aquimarina sp. U1-2]|uniref:peptidoglycan DD-metalloendopeptidase family protein n=1 Tax=Aquimarina sp. U1-2 TaxID=2823141 RepID=UPI001AECFCE7|nr:peptidoglycan DD-metalloendopeptidase family protein [Aquimarina sp. U1-2]MBP2830649.1 peptidoglycan DD-metalloendopeptidase family protein [Aquimarina sp. U1-2]